MASLTNRESNEGKASSLPEGAVLSDSRSQGAGEPDGRRRSGKRALSDGRNYGRKYAFLMDIVLILVIVGLGVGGWFGYSYVRKQYAPSYETRPVIFCVELDPVQASLVTYDEDGIPTVCGQSIWASPEVEADCLGTVVAAETVLTDGQVLMYLTVETDALYRVGEGYLAGSTRLLAGEEQTYRLAGLVAKGRIITLKERTE